MDCEKPPLLDLAIVGGGLAGTYAAYRISRLRPDWSIGLFESSARIGGRLLSVRAPRVDAVSAELGGMRYRTSQPLIHSIVGELGLKTRPFPVAHDDNRYFLRGNHLRLEDFAGDGPIPYRLEAPYERLSPAEAVVAAFDHVLPGATTFDEDDWMRLRREHHFGGKALAEWALAISFVRCLAKTDINSSSTVSATPRSSAIGTRRTLSPGSSSRRAQTMRTERSWTAWSAYLESLLRVSTRSEGPFT